MAEAHQAVSYSNLVKHHDHQKSDNHYDKHHIQFDGHQQSKSWNKWLSQFTRKLRNFVYPAHVESFWILFMVMMVLHFAMRVPFDVVDVVIGLLPG